MINFATKIYNKPSIFSGNGAELHSQKLDSTSCFAKLPVQYITCNAEIGHVIASCICTVGGKIRHLQFLNLFIDFTVMQVHTK